jgi:hypothetical protein
LAEIDFDSARGASRDLYVSRKVVAGDSAPELVPNVNSAADDTDPWLSADGRTLYFASTRWHGQDLLVHALTPGVVSASGEHTRAQ